MATNSDGTQVSVEDAPEIPPEVQKLNRRLEHLEAIAREYRVTIKVCAVLAERLLAATGGEVVVITDEALAEPPNLDAGRDAEQGQVWIRTSR